jgi:hypothetical protein
MGNISSFIDGSLAVVGICAAFMVSLWALTSSESADNVEVEIGKDGRRATLKKAA